MKKCYLKKISGFLLLVFAFCSAAEAGTGAMKVYRMSVTVPALTYVHSTGTSIKAQNPTMQVAMEKDVRDGQIVMLKTAVIK